MGNSVDKSKIIDIHTHILYDIDDGSETIDMSTKLMGMAYDQGVRGIFCTNHSYGMKDAYKDYHRRFEKLCKAANEQYPGLALYKGCEIASWKDKMGEIIAGIKDDVYPTMNGTDYVLMEFSPNRTAGMDEMLYCLDYALNKGYIPIVAHVERYRTLYNDPLQDMIRLKELGCLIQINLYSVEQDQGLVGGGSRKELANLFLRNHLVDLVGTDTHRLDYKSPEATVGALALREKYGSDYADAVLYLNAEKMLVI